MAAAVGPCLVSLLLLTGTQSQEVEPSAELIEQRAAVALRELKYRNALRAYETVIALEPNRASAHYGKGVALSGLLDYAGAVAALERAVSLDPDVPAAWRQLTILYAQLGRRESASQAFEKAHSLGRMSPSDRLPLGRALRKAGLLEQAATVLDGERGSNSPELLQELGLLEMDRGNEERAVELLSHAASDPSAMTTEALYALGRCLESFGETDSAVERYRLVLKREAHHRQARFRLGNLLLRSGRDDEGRALLHGYERYRQWDRQVKLLLAMISSGTLSPEDEKQKTLQAIELLLREKALPTAATLIESGLASHPQDPSFKLARSRWLVLSERFDEAQTELAPLLSPPDPLADAFWLSGQIHLRQGRLKDALTAYHAFLDRSSPPPAGALKELATAYALKGEVEQAKAYFEAAIERDPSLAEAHADLGLLLESGGELEKATEHYRRALQIDPHSVAALQGLGSILLQGGEAVEAEELFRRSVELSPKDPVLRKNWALALERCGKTEEGEAERLKAEALEKAPP